MDLPQRRWLYHTPPPWVRDATYFITIDCAKRGRDQLCATAVAEKLLAAVRYYHDHGRWHVRLWLVMPDHMHALVACPRTEDLAKVVAAWKRYTARQAGIEWQKGFFDHRLRSDESFEEKAFYIRMNPVRKGFVADPGDWPHVWTLEADGKEANGSESRSYPVAREDDADASVDPGRDATGRDASPRRPPHPEPRTAQRAVPTSSACDTDHPKTDSPDNDAVGGNDTVGRDASPRRPPHRAAPPGSDPGRDGSPSRPPPQPPPTP